MKTYLHLPASLTYLASPLQPYPESDYDLIYAMCFRILTNGMLYEAKCGVGYASILHGTETCIGTQPELLAASTNRGVHIFLLRAGVCETIEVISNLGPEMEE